MSAWLIKEKDIYKVGLRYGGRLYKRSLKTRKEKQAQTELQKVQSNLHYMELGLIEMPEGADLIQFLRTDGRRTTLQVKPVERKTLKGLFDSYQHDLPTDAKADTTRATERVHMGHITRILGAELRMPLALADLQAYIRERSQEDGRRGNRVGANTIEKELDTLHTIWTWAVKMGLVQTPMPKDGLVLPVTADKLPFMTRKQVEQQLGRGGLSPAEEAALWESLYLDLDQIESIVDYVEVHGRCPYVYPMFLIAAHTGARRSEILRSRIEDFDFEARMVTIREKKKQKGKITFRHVPMSPRLQKTMRRWFADHPGGQPTISEGPDQSTSVSMTNHQFGYALEGSDWHGKLRGWHVFRHSFASNCARKRVDQRLIDQWLGHTTPEMRRRYQHLFPDDQHEQLKLVFG